MIRTRGNREKAVSEFFNLNTYLENRFNIYLRKSIISGWISDDYTNAKILDIGCGDGSLSLPWIRKNEVVLMDTATQMLDLAKKQVDKLNANIQPKYLKQNILGYETDERFNLIFCVGVLAHVSSIDAVLKQICHLLAADGQVILQISNINHFRYRRLKSGTNSYGYELNKISKNQFEDKLKSFGLKVLETKGYSWTFFPLNRLNQDMQFMILNRIRKISFFNFMSSEWLFLVTNK